MLKLEVPQEGLEEALRDYVAKLGLTLAITDISFTAQKGGKGIRTDLTLGAQTAETPVERSPAKAVTFSDTAAEDAVAEEEATFAIETVVEAEAEEPAAEIPAGTSIFAGASAA